jgi:hypothetical protein
MQHPALLNDLTFKQTAQNDLGAISFLFTHYSAWDRNFMWMPYCSGSVTASPESVITSMAGFEALDGCGSAKHCPARRPGSISATRSWERVSNDRVVGVRAVSSFSAISRHNWVACHTVSGQCETESCAARGIVGNP